MTKFSTRVDLDESKRNALVEGLNITLGTTLDLFSQVKHAHWNIKGAQFVARHELFDQLADHLRGWADDVAERATTLGGYAEGTIRQAAKCTHLPEYDMNATGGRAHVLALAERYGKYCSLVREMVGTAQKHGDPATEDLFTEVLRAAEMDLWFLEAHLQDDRG